MAEDLGTRTENAETEVPRRVGITDEALRDLEEIRTYLLGVSPQAERRVASDFEKSLDLLSRYPEIGRVISKGRRQLATMAPYILRYRVEPSAVVVISIRHGARASEDPTDT